MSSLSRIYGPPGQTKSFLILDIALSLASGHPWRIGGETKHHAPKRVHYVMAEGHTVNSMRANAWLRHHDPDGALDLRGRLRDTFHVIISGVTLTPEGIGQYLPVVENDKPALLVLDTKHRMMAGLDENSASDMAVMVRALDMLREASEGCVCLVDHTGLFDDSRARGSSAVQAAMDTEIRVTYKDRIAEAKVTRDKAAEAGKTWRYRLAAVAPAAVPVPLTDGEVVEGGFAEHRQWHQREDLILIAKVNAVGEQHCGHAGCPKDGHQQYARAHAYNILRILTAGAGDTGMTRGEVAAELKAAHLHDTNWSRGLNMLKHHGLVAGEGDTRSRFVLC